MINRRHVLRGSGIAAGAAALGLAGISPASAAGQPSPPAFLPLPESVKPLPVNADGYRLERVGRNGYVLIYQYVQSVFVVTRTGVVLVDAPPLTSKVLRAAIASVTNKPVTHFFYTHSHADHVAGVTNYPRATRIAHRDTATLLTLHNDPSRPKPHVVINEDHKVLYIGGEEIHVVYPGANHESGNILVHFPAQGLTAMSDVVMPGWAPYRAWGNADYLPGILAGHDAILGTDFTTYVGGHIYRTGTRAEVRQSREFFLDFWTTTQKTLGNISLPEIQAGLAEPLNGWAAQKVWIDRIAQSVMSEMIDRWGTKIAAVDTFTADCAGAAAVSILTDAPVDFP
ncbi:MBL fold metallo-hydrolase [Streptomyces sp. NPDC047061]|uniref:MBL fold metallo-hydrolase n=1 Tax=Streptomyces sp. NPDC047061 TaxID=3154605 RepID=UPI0033D1691F